MIVQVLMPMYKVMDAPAVASLVAFMLDATNKGDSIRFSYSNVADVARARNGLLKSVSPDADYILWIDSDMTYRYSDFLKLVDQMDKNKLPMLSAKYYTRNVLEKTKKLAMLERLPSGELTKILASDESGLRECDVVGFGFCAMRPDLIDELRGEYGKLFKWDEDGEDAYFCKLVQRAGHSVYYDSDVLVGHITQVINK